MLHHTKELDLRCFTPRRRDRCGNRQHILLFRCGSRRSNWQPEGSSSTSVPQFSVWRKRKPETSSPWSSSPRLKPKTNPPNCTHSSAAACGGFRMSVNRGSSTSKNLSLIQRDGDLYLRTGATGAANLHGAA